MFDPFLTKELELQFFEYSQINLNNHYNNILCNINNFLGANNFNSVYPLLPFELFYNSQESFYFDINFPIYGHDITNIFEFFINIELTSYKLSEKNTVLSTPFYWSNFSELHNFINGFHYFFHDNRWDFEMPIHATFSIWYPFYISAVDDYLFVTDNIPIYLNTTYSDIWYFYGSEFMYNDLSTLYYYNGSTKLEIFESTILNNNSLISINKPVNLLNFWNITEKSINSDLLTNIDYFQDRVTQLSQKRLKVENSFDQKLADSILNVEQRGFI